MADLVLTPWQQQVSCFFSALLPGLFIQTSEESRALDALIEVVQHLAQRKLGQRKFIRWSECSLREYKLFAKPGAPLITTGNEPAFEDADQYRGFFDTVKSFAELDADPRATEDRSKAKHIPSTLVLADPKSALSEAANVRVLREALHAIRGTRKTIVLLANDFALPKEIANDISIVPFDLPAYQDLIAVIAPTLTAYKNMYANEKKTVVLEENMVPAFCRACSGISESESRGMVSLALARFGGFDERAVKLALKEKERIVKRSDVLECVTPTKTLSSVGGLENVKHWVHENTAVLQHPERAQNYGLKLPAGLLLTGISGSGKTLTAKAIAAEWQVPLLVCDIGNLFASHVGESEGRVREMIRISNAVAPCVVFIDELDKALASGEGSSDGGTTSRVKATILTWLQEKPASVFVIGAANNLQKLEGTPELIRRFECVFFVDLPGLEARKEIFQIHLKEAGHELSAMEVLGAAQMTAGFSGAELATVVQKALRVSFGRNLQHPSAEILEKSVSSVVPLSTVMKDQINALRNWSKAGRAIPASSHSLEADEMGQAGHDYEHGRPDIHNN